MTAKTPDSPQESRPPTAAPSTPSVSAQPAAGPVTGSTTPVAKAARPATKPPAKAPPKLRGGLGGPALVVAVFAMLIALGSSAVSVYALDVARQAKSRTADSAATRTTPTAAPGSVDVTASATAATTPTVPRVQFVPEVVRKELKVPPADGCASMFVDVDLMRVGVADGHEFYLSSCLGAPSLRVDKTSGAVPTQENPTPEVCVAQLAGSTPTTELVLPARIGLTFCLLTNKDEATRQGIPQRVAIVEVSEMLFNKSVTVAVSTYRVPAS